MTVRFEEERIDSLLDAIEGVGGPGAAIGVNLNGTPVYRKAAGLASVELPLALTPHIRFRVGSITKQFTCLALLLLCDDGLAELGTPIRNILPELHPVHSNVTLHQLMGHTSGIRDVYNLFSRFNDPRDHFAGPAQRTGSRELYDFYATIDDLEFESGSHSSYNNGAYLIITKAIERLANRRLGDLMLERIFQPIGMFNSEYLESDADFVANRCSQHVALGDGRFQRHAWGLDNFAGAGAVISNLDDMLAWLRHLDKPVVGSEGTWRAMRSAVSLNNGAPTQFGLGIELDRHGALETLSHGGGAFGGNAQILKVPEAGLDIVVLVNRQDLSSTTLSNRISEHCLGQYGAEILQPAETASMVIGVYVSSSGHVVEVGDCEGRMTLAIDGGIALPLARVGDDLWTIIGFKSAAKLTISLVNAGALLLSQYGKDTLFERVDKGATEDTPTIWGEYRCAPARAAAEIHLNDSGVLMATRGPFGSVTYRLQRISSRLWRAQSAHAVQNIGINTGVLQFAANASSFLFSSGTTALLPFERSTGTQIR